MVEKKKSKQVLIAYTVLRCPFVRNDAHRCSELCSPVGGFGLCGRRANHESRLSGRSPRVIFVISRDKVA